MTKNPISQFSSWMRLARKTKSIVDPTAACLSTLGAGQFPAGRMVLLKGLDERGFVFYTNLRSTKGRELSKNRKAALTFHWAPLERQVRIQGRTEFVSNQEADAYWKTRPRTTQLGAWASRQSERLLSRAVLLKEVSRFAKKFGKGPVPRPPYWTGVRIRPTKVEFWQGRANRLHDRMLFTRAGRNWKNARLYP
jgi:pyridoxamine 5'-phosphate oxidase